MKTFCLSVVTLLSIITLSSCNKNTSILGEWVEPVPGMESMKQGFKLEAGGKATSINMATLQYKTWKQQDGSLLLSGESIGNGQTISFTDTLGIRKQTNDSLILKARYTERVYTRH